MLSTAQQIVIRQAERRGVDMSPYVDGSYDAKQLLEIAEGLLSGVDVQCYTYPDISHDEMRKIRVDTNLEAKRLPTLDDLPKYGITDIPTDLTNTSLRAKYKGDKAILSTANGTVEYNYLETQDYNVLWNKGLSTLMFKK